jgi:hypothetical protein
MGITLEMKKDIEVKVAGWVACYVEHEFMEQRIMELETLLKLENCEFNKYQLEVELKLINERMGL